MYVYNIVCIYIYIYICICAPAPWLKASQSVAQDQRR